MKNYIYLLGLSALVFAGVKAQDLQQKLGMVNQALQRTNTTVKQLPSLVNEIKNTVNSVKMTIPQVKAGAAKNRILAIGNLLEQLLKALQSLNQIVTSTSNIVGVFKYQAEQDMKNITLQINNILQLIKSQVIPLIPSIADTASSIESTVQAF